MNDVKNNNLVETIETIIKSDDLEKKNFYFNLQQKYNNFRV